MATSAQQDNLVTVESTRPYYVEYRTQIISGIVGIAGILAVLGLLLEIEFFVPLLQFFLVGVVLYTVITTLTSKTVRDARKWHGVDWWLATVSGVLLAFFFIIGIIPEYLAPYDFNEEIGPAVLSPGQQPDNYVLITRDNLPYESFEDIAYQLQCADTTTSFELALPEANKPLGECSDIIINRDEVNASNRARGVGSVDEVAGRSIGQAREESGFARNINIDRNVRDVTPEEALTALSQSDLSDNRPLVAVAGKIEDFEPLVPQYGNLRVLSPIGEVYDSGFVFGTTRLGEDVFSRLLFGARTTLLISISAALFASSIGIPLGLISGYAGGVFDRIMAPLMDSIYSFPALILAIAIAAALGRGVGTVIGAIGVIYIPTYYRIVRSQTLAIKEAAYVEAARSLGARNRTILFRYIFPNVFASVTVIFSINIADAILTGAALSFLGLGLPEFIPDWGVDLVKGFEEFTTGNWWLWFFPGVAISILTLCFSLLGESLSEILNPRLNRS